WETLDLLTLVLTCWTKIKPVRLGNTMAMLERQLRQWSALLPETATPSAVGLPEHAEQDGVADQLWQIAGLPDWLEAAAQPEAVGAALARRIPEFASGDLTLRSCKLKRMRLKDTSGRWGGVYALKVDDPRSAGTQTVQIRATLSAPGIQPDTADE